jgi:uncharacterized SAM-binding protein YcdF (DUF218 family)
MFFILSKALLFLISPFNWFIILLIGYFLSRKEPIKTRFKWGSILLFFFFSNTFVFSEFCRIWEVHGTKMAAVSQHDAGIVLTGMAEYNSDLDELSIRRGGDRIWQAITLYKTGKIKKIILTGDSGYVTDRGLHEAKQVKSVLVRWGIPDQDILTEENSKNTAENAIETKKMLDRSYPHLEKFLLITSGIHMRRAQGCFSTVGISCTPFSTDLYTGPKRNYYLDQLFLPNPSTFQNWETLIKEVVGYITYDIVGFID